MYTMYTAYDVESGECHQLAASDEASAWAEAVAWQREAYAADEPQWVDTALYTGTADAVAMYISILRHRRGSAAAAARLVRMRTGQQVACVRREDVAVSPMEPDCDDGGEHIWDAPHDLVGGCQENPGVWGHGGGVVIVDVCLRCGTVRRTDTWATDRRGREGRRAVTYEPYRWRTRLEEVPR